MLAIIGFIVAIAAIYTIKAVAISKTYDDLAEKSATFSWASVRPEDVAVAESWTVENEAKVPQRQVSLGALRHAGA